MGTKHRQSVISKDGKLIIQQYGQWDGYPSGQGVEILEYLQKGNLDKYQEELVKIPKINSDQVKLVNADSNWHVNYPYLSKNCGSRIHQLIEDGKVNFVRHIDEEEAREWCEGFYEINFQANTFTAEFYDSKKVYQLDELPTEEQFLLDMEGEE